MLLCDKTGVARAHRFHFAFKYCLLAANVLHASRTTIVMATMTPLPAESLRALDQLRLRLSQLANSISQTRAELEHSQPLPEW